MTKDESQIRNYAEFWDFYVAEHAQPLTRHLHFAGSMLAIILLVWFVRRGTWFYFPLCLIVGYAFAWFAHFYVEHNKPTTIKYPLWSFASDYKMVWLMLTGRMDAEVARVSDKK
jgi:hypothetical protein